MQKSTTLTLHLSPLQLSVVLILFMAAFTAVFAHWTATSMRSFPHFVGALLFLVYCPGRFLVDSAKLGLPHLEHTMLALVLGTTTSSGLYWLSTFLHAPHLFWIWPAVAGCLCLWRIGTLFHTWRGMRLVVDGSHLLLLGLMLLCCSLLAVVPLYYRNLSQLSDGGLTYALLPHDVELHLAITQELTHTIPPTTPFISGHPLCYHYAMDLLSAMFSQSTGLNSLDLIVRFIPTFYLLVTILGIYCFGRAWLQSSYGAVLLAFLVLFGEDFSFIPGLLSHRPSCWCADYFGVPTVFSLFCMNAMLPALAVLFCGLFCLGRFLQDGKRMWWGALTVLLLTGVIEYKVFVTIQVLLSLAIAGCLRLVVRRDIRLVMMLVPCALLAATLVLPTWRMNEAGAGQSLSFQPSVIPRTLNQSGWDAFPWMQKIHARWPSGNASCGSVAALLFMGLPLYLAGSLGLRALAVPQLCKEFLCPKSSCPARLFLAVYFFVGLVLTLTCVVVHRDYPVDQQYNNGVWFYVQSKYLAWIFVVEWFLAHKWIRGVGLRGMALAVMLGLSIPSSVDFFRCAVSSFELGLIDKEEMELVHFLNRDCARGEVVLTRPTLATVIVSLTTCHTPIVPELYAYSLIRRNELERRVADRDAFWSCWDNCVIRVELLDEYHVDYVVDRNRPGVSTAAPIEGHHYRELVSPRIALEVRFANAHYTVYKVRRRAETS